MIRRPPRSPLFPYTTLSRSRARRRPGLLGRMPAKARAKPGAPAVRHVQHDLTTGLPFASRSMDRVNGKDWRSEEHTSELQSQSNLVCRLLLEKKITCMQAMLHPHNTLFLHVRDTVRNLTECMV